jgi:hypothetical protein
MRTIWRPSPPVRHKYIAPPISAKAASIKIDKIMLLNRHL